LCASCPRCMLYDPLISSPLFLSGLINVVIFGEECKLWRFSLFNLLHRCVVSCPYSPQHPFSHINT
jgi:hypothetical protein